jgi:hypothetical protein
LPICRRKVLHAWLELEELADRLLSCNPVDVRGVAQAQLLLADGGGPLYIGPGLSDLEPVLRSAVDALALDLSGLYSNDA